MFIDFLASLSFYFIPFLLGRLFLRRTIQAYALGLLILYIIYFIVAGTVNFFPELDFTNTIKLIVIFLCSISVINLLILVFRQRDFKLKNILFETISYIFILLFSVFIYFFIFKRNTPYPMNFNWDIYEHITLANLIAKGNLSLIPSEISDTFTFDGYTSLFQVLLSVPKVLFNTNLLGVYWFLEYWHYFLSILAFFLLAKRIFNDKWLSLVSVIIGGLVFESIVVYNPFFLIPQTFSALLAVFMIYEFITQGLKSWILYLVLMIPVLLIHYIVGFLSIVFFIIFIVFRRKFFLDRINIFTILALVLLIGGVLLNFLGSWNLTQREEAMHFNFDLSRKINYFLEWYGIGLPFFLVLGFLKTLFKGSEKQKMVLVLSMLTLLLVLLPASYVLKFYAIGSYFVNIIIVAGIGALLHYLPVKIKPFATLWLGISLLVVFYSNQATYKEFLYFKGLASHVSKAEIDTATWLSSAAKPHTLLISDPSTQYILEAVSGVNTQGGVYASARTRRILNEIRFEYDTGKISEKLLSINDQLETEQDKRDNTIWVLSGRYFAWQELPENEKNSFFYNIWTPKKLEDADKAYIDFLIRSNKFKKIYGNEEMVILEL